MKGPKYRSLKDVAAAHWHRKRGGGCSLADAFGGDRYVACFKLHEIAFLAGYAAGRASASKKGARRHDSK